MRKINQKGERVYKYLKGIEPLIWSRNAFNDDVKVDHITNNMIDNFNSWLSRVRSKPIIEQFEDVRRKIMRRIVRRKEKAKKWVTPF